MIVKADFHIHSCLSPCGSLTMSPSVIVENAKKAGLNLIAISDHNSARNCPALFDICENDAEIQCMFAIEATTMEEAHILCLFDNIDAIMEFDALIYASLLDYKNIPSKMGDQIIVNKDENITGKLDKFLPNAVSYGAGQLARLIHKMGGICIPAHIFRPGSSLSSQLGYVPDIGFDALEVSRFYFKTNPTPIKNFEKYRLITNSDAHFPEDIGKNYNLIEIDKKLKEVTLNDLVNALQNGKWELQAPL